MAEETSSETAVETEAAQEKEHEETVAYERFQQANQKAKKEAAEAKEAKKEAAELKRQLEEREQAGLPELEQLKKRVEQAEKRAEAAEQERDSSKTDAANARKERWVEQAATDAKFVYPDLAVREVDLEKVESREDAERAVKRVAKARPKLIETEEPTLPGRVLANGQPPPATAAKGGIDPGAEADQLAQSLQQFLKNRSNS